VRGGDLLVVFEGPLYRRPMTTGRVIIIGALALALPSTLLGAVVEICLGVESLVITTPYILLSCWL
jgi:hypothetical protein